VGTGAKQHDIDTAIDYALIRIEAVELAFLGEIQAIFHPGIRVVRLDGLFELILKQIAARDEFAIGVGLECVFDRTVAAPAKTDQTNTNDIGTRGVRHAGIA
jgi:hypothetical protein